MSKVAKIFVLAILVLAVAVPLVSAAHHLNIVQTAADDGRFTTLVAAVNAAGLADSLSGGEWTLFAPTDTAFAKLGLNASNIAGKYTKAQLTDILLYHAMDEEVSSFKAASLAGDVTMANGKLAGLKIYKDNVYVNDDAKVIDADITASNGVIHAVDTVILGPWPRDGEAEAPGAPSAPTGDSIVDIAVADGRFTTLVAAVQAAGLADALSGGEWTVFAPTDTAFAKLGLNASNVATSFTKAELTDILLYHALDEEVSSFKAASMAGDVTMANGKLAGLKVYKDDVYVNDDAKVIEADIVADNGVIHVVDTVILGPWPRAE